MLHCERCGASLDPTALACPYCHLTTPAGIAAQARAAQAAEAARIHAQQAAAAQAGVQHHELRRVEKMAAYSLIWSVSSLVVCCFPLGVVGIIMGLRARSAATTHRLRAPFLATLGILIGAMNCLVSFGGCTYAYIDSRKNTARANAQADELEKAVGASAERETLERSTACQLAEARVLRSGFDRSSGWTLNTFECHGKLEQTGPRAVLHDFRFYGTNKEYTAFVCFKRGARWYVDSVSAKPCASSEATTPDAGTDASAAPRTSASPAARPRKR